MKTNFSFIILALILSVGFVNCNNKNNYDYSYDTAVYEEEETTTEVDNEQQSMIDPESIPELKDYKGLYKVTDENGTEFDIYFTKENSVIITTSNGKIYYCMIMDYTSIDSGIYIEPSEGEFKMQFKGGEETVSTFGSIVLKDNWIYGSRKYSESNNPNWRLPVTVEKAYPTEKASSYSSSSSSSSTTSSEPKTQAQNKKEDTVDEEELKAIETMMYGYNEAAWRAKRRADERNR